MLQTSEKQTQPLLLYWIEFQKNYEQQSRWPIQLFAMMKFSIFHGNGNGFFLINAKCSDFFYDVNRIISLALEFRKKTNYWYYAKCKVFATDASPWLIMLFSLDLSHDLQPRNYPTKTVAISPRQREYISKGWEMTVGNSSIVLWRELNVAYKTILKSISRIQTGCLTIQKCRSYWNCCHND